MPTTDIKRHNNMAAIKGKDTKPEMVVRKFLWSRGYRYTLNHPRLPGKPDIVLRKYRTCIFVNGCFWHGHTIKEMQGNGTARITGCHYFKMPNTNRDYWENKIHRNQIRDIEVQHKLAEMGWHCITIWECELKPSTKDKTLNSLDFTLNKIFLSNHNNVYYSFPEDSDWSKAAEDINSQ